MPHNADASAAFRPLWLVDGLAAEQRFARRFVARGRLHLFAYEFVRFGVKKAWACLFGASILLLLLGTWLWYPRNAALSRYDFLLICAIGLQTALVWTKAETLRDAAVIAVFHVAGTLLELVKTAQGVWTYPGDAILKIGDVPLFTGFMYACVGSFMVRTWRLFDFRFERHPPLWLLAALSAAIYLNFMLHRWFVDLRPGLYVVAGLVLVPCTIHYKIWRQHRRMPMLVAALLTALFIWIAENLGTLSRTWVYAHQVNGWNAVSLRVYLGWFLLMIVSYTLVVWLQREIRAPERRPGRKPKLS